MARVLVVDDEEGIRRTTGLFLQGAGHAVRTAGTVAEARLALEEGDVDVVLSDIIMPGEDGIRLLESIRQKNPRVQVVLITGEPTLETATEALRLGAFDYLPKPVTKAAIVGAVERAQRTKALLDENARLAEDNERYRDRLEAQVATRTAQLSTALRGVIGVVATAVESRDPYTAGHQKRVAALSAAIAGEMGLDEHRTEGVMMAAAVHDVGMISIPADILSKPARLNAAERGLVHLHCAAGHAIFADVAVPWPVADVILQHHERLDGSGYPAGLRGEAILLEARIIAVADVVEAMASHRPYRPALGLQAGLDEIERSSGQRYDPAVVAACLRLFREKAFSMDRA